MTKIEILSLKDIHASYYKKEILHGISISINENEIISLIGPNGSGKSTLLKVIAGILPPLLGEINFYGENITKTPIRDRVRKGIGYFIQGGAVFPSMSVKENLYIGAMSVDKSELNALLERIFFLFPDLKKVMSQRVGTLSGGEKQAVALGMILIRKPKLLLLDEPLAGLSPNYLKHTLEIIKTINAELGTTIILVEQNIKESLAISHRVSILKEGQIIAEKEPKKLTIEQINSIFFS